MTANEKPVFDKLLSLPIGARCVEPELYGDKFGANVYVFVGLVMCGRETRGLTSGREERLYRKRKVEERNEIDGMFANIRHNRFSRSLCENVRPWVIYSFSH